VHTFIRKGTAPALTLTRRSVTTARGDAVELPLLTAPLLENLTGIRHCFTTREGGVSTGALASLNLKERLGDDPENVRENFRRVAQALGVTPGDFVLTDQTHTANVRVVTEDDRGKGVTRERDYKDVDALVTNVPGIVLAVFFADCVPILFADPVHRAIGAAHSGWRGTDARIADKTIRAMQEHYGTNPEDLFCVIGPSICRECYEVSGDVADVFRFMFPRNCVERSGTGGEESSRTDHSPDVKHPVVSPGRPGHAQLDLWAANRLILEESGVRPERIETTDLCTCCNKELLFSHRGSNGKRGVLGGFLGLI
jgi:YfiH family protein